MKPTKCPAKETKNEARKVKVKTAVSDLLEILLSVHARTSQANNIILHMYQEAAKCTTCKQLCGKL